MRIKHTGLGVVDVGKVITATPCHCIPVESTAFDDQSTLLDHDRVRLRSQTRSAHHDFQSPHIASLSVTGVSRLISAIWLIRVIRLTSPPLGHLPYLIQARLRRGEALLTREPRLNEGTTPDQSSTFDSSTTLDKTTTHQSITLGQPTSPHEPSQEQRSKDIINALNYAI